MDQYLQETKMLDYSNKNIQQLIENRNWKKLNEFECLKAIYNFVRDEIQEMSKPKAFAYRNLGRHLMNRNVRKIRNL